MPKSIGPSVSFKFADIVPPSSKVSLATSETLSKTSNEPLTGSYVIECYEPGFVAENVGDTAPPKYTAPIDAYATTSEIYSAIVDAAACPGLRNKFSVVRYGDYKYAEDGLNFLLFFEKVEETLPQFRIINNESDLGQDGQQPLTGINVDIVNEEISPRGPNVWYDTIPFEYIYTIEDEPQVLVEIDGHAALCGTLECGFTYEDPVSEVTDMQVNGLDVTLTGTALSTDIVSVTLGYTNCVVTSNDEASIACTLESPLFAGSWEPEVRDVKGLYPTAPSLTAVEVDLLVASVSPTSGYNPAGGDKIMIAGSGFPSSILDTLMSVTFDDGTICDLMTISASEMMCRTRSFEANAVQRRR